MVEFSSCVDEETPTEWVIFVDGASNIKASSTEIVLKGPGDILIEQALKLDFTTSNNQAEYEALIVGMILSLEMGASRLKTKTDS